MLRPRLLVGAWLPLSMAAVLFIGPSNTGLAWRETTVRKEATLQTVGLYVAPPEPHQSHFLDFYRACGYNYLEFCDSGCAIRPDVLPGYYANVGHAITTAQRKGFRVWILLLAGMRQWKGPGESGNAGTFSALDRPLLNERLAYIRNTVRSLKHADGFAFFAGDPGGDPEGRSTIHDCLSFAREVRDIVKQEAPEAGFVINLWAVAEWAGFPSPFTLDFWEKQVLLTRYVVREGGLLGPDCGVVFSLDNYYRSLTLRCYSDNGVKPALYPTRAAVARLRQRGVKPIYGWPYFLVDECDDGFVTPNNIATGGQSQAETRYIHAIVRHGRALGLDGLVANASWVGVAAEPLNIWTFARMCHDSSLTPEQALDRYAGLVASPETAHDLGQVLRFIENNSSWHHSLPAEYRLPALPCRLTSAAQAREVLGRVTPRDHPGIVLPEAPSRYLERLANRLRAIEAGELGGPNPHMPPPQRKTRPR